MEDCLSSTKIIFESPSIEMQRSKLGTAYWNMGPMLQGLLMESAPKDLCEYLHSCPFNPYSQYCAIEDGKLIWTLNSLTSAIDDALFVPVIRSENLLLKKFNFGLKFADISKTFISRKNLASLIHDGDGSIFSLNFITPCAFRSGGAYQNIPNMHLVYQNLLMHYSQVYEASSESDTETVQYLSDHTRIAKYNLHSSYFNIAGKSIPAFCGKITVEVSGSGPTVGLARMLLNFATYSGVGIKTSMGMGGMVVKCMNKK